MNKYWRIIDSSITKKLIMSFTGLFLIAFILIHAIGNSTSFFGRKAFLSYISKLHSLGFLITFFEILLLVFFLLHIITGLRLFLANKKARPIAYKEPLGLERNVSTKFMPYTGIIILTFISIHIWCFRTASSLPIPDLVKFLLSQPKYAFLYLVGILALGLHIKHGFWSLFQTLGLYHNKYNKFLEKSSLFFSISITLIFLMIILLCFFSLNFLKT